MESGERSEHGVDHQVDVLEGLEGFVGENMLRVLSSLAEVCDHSKRPDEGVKWRSDLAKLQAATQPSSRRSTQPATAPTS